MITAYLIEGNFGQLKMMIEALIANADNNKMFKLLNGWTVNWPSDELLRSCTTDKMIPFQSVITLTSLISFLSIWTVSETIFVESFCSACSWHVQILCLSFAFAFTCFISCRNHWKQKCLSLHYLLLLLQVSSKFLPPFLCTFIFSPSTHIPFYQHIFPVYALCPC